MVYCNQFVVTIIHNGKVLREVDGRVYLPFNTNYTIRLKNLFSTIRCKTKIKIDGSYIHPDGYNLVLRPNETVDLERMLIDGNLEHGPKLKFVPITDSRVSDPSNPENGIIEVEVYEEIKQTFFYTPYCPPTFPYYVTYDNFTTCCSANISEFSNANGATVAGEDTSQKFTMGEDFNTVSIPQIIRLKLTGLDKPVFVEDTRKKYCIHCGKKNPYKAKFCMRCGEKFA